MIFCIIRFAVNSYYFHFAADNYNFWLGLLILPIVVLQGIFIEILINIDWYIIKHVSVGYCSLFEGLNNAFEDNFDMPQFAS